MTCSNACVHVMLVMWCYGCNHKLYILPNMICTALHELLKFEFVITLFHPYLSLYFMQV